MGPAMSYTDDELTGLIDELRAEPNETEWIEFKVNNGNPDTMGENIAALSNSATLHGKDKGYLVYGIDDGTHDVVGTTLKFHEEKVGAEELEHWLNKMLDPSINFVIYEMVYGGTKPVTLIEIDGATGFATSFKKRIFIRVGSYTKPIADHRGKEKALWDKLDKKTFEVGIAKSSLDTDNVLDLIDYQTVFRRLGYPTHDTKAGIIDKLVEEAVIVRSRSKYAVTNLGAILFATDLSKFETLSRKALRVIKYTGKDKLETEREVRGKKGYAVGIDNIVNFIQTVTPAREVMEGATLKKVPAYPLKAVRETVANALIHQDFSIGGAGPMVEIYDNRIEISNPGAPLVDIRRIIDHSPRSRNEKLAGIMARMEICEERGSGVDKVVIACELNQLPAPKFKEEDDFTRATLFTHRSLRDMTKEDKIRATYYHAVIKYIQDGYMTNNTLRERFGIAKENYPTASGIIKFTLDAGYIKTRDAETSTKYVPIWA
jgi:predicted HTH transcriptional regulator